MHADFMEFQVLRNTLGQIYATHLSARFLGRSPKRESLRSGVRDERLYGVLDGAVASEKSLGVGVTVTEAHLLQVVQRFSPVTFQRGEGHSRSLHLIRFARVLRSTVSTSSASVKPMTASAVAGSTE